MKTRQGFVSNSSTASFVVIGIKIEQEKLQAILGEEGYDNVRQGYRNNHMAICGDGDTVYIGKEVVRTSDDGIQDGEVDIEMAIAEVKAFLKKNKLPQKPIMLYSGTEQC